MTQELLNLFNRAIPTTNNVSFTDTNKYTTQVGYIVHPDLCNSEVINYLKTKEFNPNTTFYNTWNDIVSKNRFELYIDQIKHYITTYGTNYTETPYIPANNVETINFTNYKVILPITKEEVISKCEQMLFTGIALKQETINSIMIILNKIEYKIDVSKVNNREAKLILYKELNQLPTEPVEMVRFLVYISTGSTLLIKNHQTINTIKNNPISVTEYINQFGVEKLSSVFYRFKPIFLAFKENDATIINKLRRLAKTNHIPTKKTFFEDILINQSKYPFILDRLKELNNFKKITLLQTINIIQKNLTTRPYIIRNQKMFLKENTNNLKYDKTYLNILYSIIYNSLIESLKEKATTITLPKNINLTLPTSEKSFIGNYPLGTSFDLPKSNAIIGINWKQSDGAHDLDLSLIDINSVKYGWNANYTNNENSVIYSGDMTSADPEATELFYTTKNFNPSIVKVNLYYGNKDSKFKFFIANEEIRNLERNHMVDPNTILFSIDNTMDSQEKSIGVITGDKFILSNFKTGTRRVSNNSVTNLYTDYTLNTIDTYISLEKVLIDAGFIITTNNSEIDLNNLSKDTVINLIK